MGGALGEECEECEARGEESGVWGRGGAEGWVTEGGVAETIEGGGAMAGGGGRGGGVRWWAESVGFTEGRMRGGGGEMEL